MRILLIHQYFLSADDAGGSRWNQMAKFWAAQGHEITVLAGTVHYATGLKAKEYRGKLVVTERVGPGIKVKRCHVSSRYNKSFMGRLWAYFSFTLTSLLAGIVERRPDVLICTSPPLTVGLTGAILRVLWRRPMVFEVRDLWPETAIETGVLKNPLLIKLSFWLERLSYRHANWINVLTPAFKESLVQTKGIDPERISVITNAADLDTFQPGAKDNRVRRQFNLGDKFVVTYVGAHGVANHLIQLLEAARILQEWSQVHFLLIGDGMQKPMLKKKAAEWGLANVTFVDSVPKHEIVDYVAASDVCTAVLKRLDVFKTVYPNKVFDYMSAARPVILAIDGVARELVEKAGAGVFVPPEDPVAFAQAVRELKDNPAACEEFGRSGLGYVQEHFSRERLAARYMDILKEQVCGAPRARAVLSGE